MSQSKNQFPQTMVCICCPIGCALTITLDQTTAGFLVTGNRCPRGKKYAKEELTSPKRLVTSTVKITGGLHPVIPVKTAQSVPKEKLFTIMGILDKVVLKTPVSLGEIVIKNAADTGVNIVTTKADLGVITDRINQE